MFHFQGKKITLPACYNELSSKQLIAIAGLLQKDHADNDDTLQLKVLYILTRFAFFRMSADVKAKLISPYITATGEVQESPIAWVLKENTLTEQLLPTYKGYHGPKKEFDNITLAEFHFTEVFYRQFIEGTPEEKTEALNSLVAVLYRKPKLKYDKKKDSDGDIRIAFNANELAFYANKIARWPLNVKLAVLLFYDGCRQNLAASYEKIFRGGSGNDNKAGMFGIIRGLAGTKYGDFDKVENLNIHTAMQDIEEQIDEAEKIERQTPVA